ncbi:MAG: helix-turn-helix transcriptional regulator [Clostridia bacterium]|nr:helix-turn-helix transcriptional regulator [Clostridia bacterium]
MNSFCENPIEALRLQKVEGMRIQPHLHTSAELLFIEKGEAALTTGTLEYKLTKGDFVFIMPSMLHCIIPDGENTVVYVINIKCELITDIIKRYSGLRPASPVLKAINVPSQLLYALSALSTERDKNIAHSWIHLMVSIVTSKLRFAEIHDGVTSDLSNRVLTYLSIHFREQISLDQLAEAMGVSRFHLSHLFSNKLGIGFKEYLNNLRVECAKSILRSTDIPVAEIYEASGFENQRTFNRVFRDSTGQSPRNYRIGRDEFVTPAPKPVPVEIDGIEGIVNSDVSLENVEIVSALIETPIIIEEQPAPKPKRTRTKAAKPTDAAPEPVQTPKKKKKTFILD